jgi:ABC-type nitrate/sulfonate/bicarbonate transport system substrate-binding protein
MDSSDQGASFARNLSRDAIRRRDFIISGIGGAGLLIGLGACGSGGKPKGTTTTASSATNAGGRVVTQLDFIPNVQFGGWWLAREGGFFAQEKIETKFLNGETANVNAVVAGGSADIGISGDIGGVIDAIANGADVVAFASQYQITPAAIMSKPDNPIKTAKDLLGKRIGVQPGVQVQIDAILELNKLPKDYRAVKVSFDPKPLETGQVDGYYCYQTNQPITEKLRGREVVVTSLADLGFKLYGDVLFAKRSWLEDNRELVVAWLRASIKGWEAAIAAPQAAVDAALKAGKAVGLDEKQQLLEMQSQVSLMKSELTARKGLLWMDTAEIGGVQYDALRASGRKNLPDPAKYVDLSILEDVYQGKTSLT